MTAVALGSLVRIGATAPVERRRPAGSGRTGFQTPCSQRTLFIQQMLGRSAAVNPTGVRVARAGSSVQLALLTHRDSWRYGFRQRHKVGLWPGGPR